MMKKYILISILVIFGLFLITLQPARAQMGSMMGLDNDEAQVSGDESHLESVETVLQDILNRQKISTIQDLDLAKISDNEWERLGDAVMEVQHPGQAHKLMDRMMGGEESESLRQMHINMGKAYLGYGKNFGSGMMGGGMMTSWKNNSLRGNGFPMMGVGSMMGYGAYSGYGILSMVIWILAIAFLASGTYFFIRKANKK